MCLAREQRRDVTVGDEARRSIQVLLNLTQDRTHIRASKECTLRRSISDRQAGIMKCDSGNRGLGKVPSQGIQTAQHIGTTRAGTITAGQITAPHEQISTAIQHHGGPPLTAARGTESPAARETLCAPRRSPPPADMAPPPRALGQKGLEAR
jgi:hypothetical protein